MRGKRVKALRAILNEKIPPSLDVPGFLRRNAWRRLKKSHERGERPYRIVVGPPAGFFPEHSTDKFDGTAKRAKIVKAYHDKIVAAEKARAELEQRGEA